MQRQRETKPLSPVASNVPILFGVILQHFQYGLHIPGGKIILSRKNCICTCVLFQTVSDIERFQCTVHSTSNTQCLHTIRQVHWCWRRNFRKYIILGDHLWGLVVRVHGYRSRGPKFDSRRYQIFWEVGGLKRGPLSLMRIIEELLEK
jgi:hypothetical protein